MSTPSDLASSYPIQPFRWAPTLLLLLRKRVSRGTAEQGRRQVTCRDGRVVYRNPSSQAPRSAAWHLYRRPLVPPRLRTPPPTNISSNSATPTTARMSVTTTTNARILTTANYLADYDLHHSQPSDFASSPAPAPNSHHNDSSPSTGNPPDWETQWNRVPAHRPVQNQLDEQRNTYTSEIERNFVRVMFGG